MKKEEDDTDLCAFAEAFLTEKQFFVLLRYLRGEYNKSWSENDKKHLRIVKSKVIDCYANKGVATDLYHVFYKKKEGVV